MKQTIIYILGFLLISNVAIGQNLFDETSRSSLNMNQDKFYKLQTKKAPVHQVVSVDTSVLLTENEIVLGLNNLGIERYAWSGKWINKGVRKIWKGINKNNSLLSAHFVINGSMITGEFYLGNDQFQIVPLTGDKHLIRKLDDSGLSQCGMFSKGEDRIERRERPSVDPEADNARSLGECAVRLLIAYTDDVAGLTADIISLIESQVQTFNDINDNSLVDFDVEIARTVELNYAETTTQVTHPWVGSWTFPLDMIRFWDDDDGHMDNIHGLRSLYDADMCILLLEDLTGVGGIAMDYETPGDRAFCSMDYDAGGAVFAHEFGHLIAMRHDPFVDNFNGPPGYAYGHGFTWSGAGPNFRTVMAYSNACSGSGGCARIPFWSNDDLQSGSVTMGNAGTSDNARVARQKETAIAGFEAQSNNKRVYTNDTVDDGEIANIIAGNSIINSSLLFNNPTTIIYQSGSKGLYIAPSEITFVEGFHAKSGSTFEAILESCTPNQ